MANFKRLPIKSYIDAQKGVWSEFNNDPAAIQNPDGSTVLTIKGNVNIVGSDVEYLINGVPLSASNVVISGSDGPKIETIKVVTTNYSISGLDYIIGVNGTSDVTITLPPSPELGRTYVVKNLTGGSGGFFNVIISSPTFLIDHDNTYTLGIGSSSAKLTFFGTIWGVI
jgi:hypothetical protein